MSRRRKKPPRERDDNQGFEVDERGRVRLILDGPFGEQPELKNMWIGPVTGRMTRDDFAAMFGPQHYLDMIAAAERVAPTLPAAKRAQVHRFNGWIYEMLRRPDDAIGQYELALRFDPAVGVARRLAQLKRERDPRRKKNKKEVSGRAK